MFRPRLKFAEQNIWQVPVLPDTKDVTRITPVLHTMVE